MKNQKHFKTFESFLNETKSVNEKIGHIELDTSDFENKEFQKFLKANKIDAKMVRSEGPGGNTPIYAYSGDEKDLKKMIDEFWAVDAETEKEKEEWYGLIESSLNEGAITKAIRPSLEGEVKVAVEALENLLKSTGAIIDYKHADELADCIIDIIDAAKAEERAEYKD